MYKADRRKHGQGYGRVSLPQVVAKRDETDWVTMCSHRNILTMDITLKIYTVT